jgi:lipid-A-disaccharide synthase
LRKAADKVVCLFEFEHDALRKAGVEATYLGYPLIDGVTGIRSRAQVLDRLGFRHDETYVVYLPGSRPSETDYHVPLFRTVFEHLGKQERGTRGVMVMMEEGRSQKTGGRRQKAEVSEGGIMVVSENRYDVMRHAACACAVSGTVTAELAILGVPMVVSYHLGWASRMAASVLVRVKFFALPNLLLNRLVVPEVLDPEPESLARMLAVLSRDSPERREQVEGLSRVAAKLGPHVAMRRICALALEMSPKRPERRTTNRWMPE